VKKAAAGNLFEVMVAKVAADRAASSDVNAYAKRLMADHEKASRELSRVAKDLGVGLPDKLTNEHQKVNDRFAKLSGADFDTAYINHMIKDHESTSRSMPRPPGKPGTRSSATTPRARRPSSANT